MTYVIVSASVQTICAVIPYGPKNLMLKLFSHFLFFQRLRGEIIGVGGLDIPIKSLTQIASPYKVGHPLIATK